MKFASLIFLLAVFNSLPIAPVAFGYSACDRSNLKSATPAKFKSDSLCTITLTSPANNGLFEQRRAQNEKIDHAWTFKWSDCPEATRYHLFVIGPDDVNPKLNKDDLAVSTYSHIMTTQYPITDLKGWKWKVRAFVSGAWQEWSETQTFDISSVIEPCSISGEVSGKLEYDIPKELSGGATKVKLNRMTLELVGSGETQHAIIKGRKYRFENLTVGKDYKVFPGSFRSDPPSKTVKCKSNRRYHINFKIIDSPIYD